MAKQFSKEYKALLDSWQWKFIRALVFNRDNWTCQRCKKQIRKPTKTLWLECNHRAYPPHGAPFSEFLKQPLADFETLCCKCHRQYTKRSRKKRKP